MFEVVNKVISERNGYVTRNLVNWSDDFANMSKDDFVIKMKEFAKFIFQTYKNTVKDEFEAQCERIRERELNDAIKWAEGHYKRESSKQKYIESKRKEIYEKPVPSYWISGSNRLHFFDIDAKQGTDNAMSGHSVVSEDEVETHRYDKLYDELVEYGYFKHATKLQLIYESHANSLMFCFRPKVRFILDEETQHEINDRKERLAKAMEKYYGCGRYCGD